MMDEESVVVWSVVLSCVFLLCFIAFCISVTISLEPGSGEQAGYISEVQNSGLLWRPVSITLIGSESTFSSTQTSFEYGATTPEIADKARQYLHTHQKVSVQYDTHLAVFAWNYAHASLITNITPLEK